MRTKPIILIILFFTSISCTMSSDGSPTHTSTPTLKLATLSIRSTEKLTPTSTENVIPTFTATLDSTPNIIDVTPPGNAECRLEPNTSSEVIPLTSYEFSILGKDTSENWFFGVERTSFTYCWISKHFLPSINSNTIPIIIVQAVKSVRQSNCREGPNTCFFSEKIIPENHYVFIIGKNENDGGWLLVYPQGYPDNCWIHKDAFETTTSSMIPTAKPPPPYTPTPISTDVTGNTPIPYFTLTPSVTSTFTPTPTITPIPTFHIGDLDGTSFHSGVRWIARVTITVHDKSHMPLSSATVYGSWSTGGTGECTTTQDGQCTIDSDPILLWSSTTFTVTGVTYPGWIYDNSQNHDPDGDSNGTQITISRP